MFRFLLFLALMVFLIWLSTKLSGACGHLPMPFCAIAGGGAPLSLIVIAALLHGRLMG